CETGLETLNSAPFLVDGEQQARTAQRANLFAERAKLFRRLVIAREKNHPANGRVAQQFNGRRVQRHAVDAHDQGPKWQFSAHARSNRAMDSTCAVCGNMSAMPAPTRRKPCRRVSSP